MDQIARASRVGGVLFFFLVGCGGRCVERVCMDG